MAVLKILHYPDPRLREKALPVTVFDAQLEQFVQDMLDTVASQDGGGLAATQVGRPLRIFIIDLKHELGDKNPLIVINGEIIECEGSMKSQEACFSFPGAYVEVNRSERVVLRAQNVKGEWYTFESKGSWITRCIQHELDHLDGVVMVDHLPMIKRERALEQMKRYKKVSSRK